MTMRSIVTGIVAFLVGIVVGGYLFANSLPRSFLALSDCGSSCYRANDLAGLLVSAGIQRAPGLVPGVVKETDKCVAIQHPFPEARYHVVIFPKKDIKNIAEVTLEDQPYLIDCIGVMRALVQEKELDRYRVLVNGPGFQHIAYLHLHLKSWEVTGPTPK